MNFKVKFSFEFKTEIAEKRWLQYLKFIPEDADTKWDKIEINPVFENENGCCEVVDEGNETFWSVYLHQISGGVKCVADLPSKNDAIKLAQLLNSSTKSRLR
jgi:hypothetical protein